MEKDKTLIDAFSELAPRYETVVDQELQKFWGWRYESFVDNLISSTPPEDGEWVLDLATGTSVIPRKILQAHPNTGPIIGLDITYEMLVQGQKIIKDGHQDDKIQMTCANAMLLPFEQDTFDVVFCGLALHHMESNQLIAEIKRVLKEGGVLAIADVSGSKLWKNPVVKAAIRSAAFLYFLTTENYARAWAEAGALSNIRTAEEWSILFETIGFVEIQVKVLAKSRTWIPSPLLMKATKPKQELA